MSPARIVEPRPRGGDAPGQLLAPPPRLDPGLLDGQPVPIAASAVAIYVGDAWVMTSIVREWAPGEAERCQLCPASRCNRVGPVCHRVIVGAVSPAEAYLVADDDAPRVGPAILPGPEGGRR